MIKVYYIKYKRRNGEISRYIKKRYDYHIASSNVANILKDYKDLMLIRGVDN